MNVKIFLADDHRIVRESLQSKLNTIQGIKVVGEAGNGQETVRLVGQTQPNVVVLDFAMPHLNGIEVTRRIRKSSSAIKVIILSMYKDNHYIVEAVKAGANGYVLKEESFECLIEAIEAVIKGKIYLSPCIEKMVVWDFIKRVQTEDAPGAGVFLSGREKEVLQLIAEGKTSQEIAGLLYVSASTVDTHRKNIMKKLGIHSIAGLVRYAIRNKIVPMEE